ncbi:tetratricopeptide repeat protein [Hippea maritima]|uniref:Tetratricopeptide TPR_2 repeat-containing protein n=1 Tax=Hippea maritima (strain ATCC 700847 / DSM 10411 / MH2) TaxID=760142 RepID=F2LUG6_HIPMA|nr:tetratricopeptide repeat protein [Hippea maritima]AEA33492.1 Tetratricopeptide TPR_2 repeat-containing protein [Hippea maritima DSM 10411]
MGVKPKKTEELLQYGIESFLNNRFDRAKTFFSLVLSKEPTNNIAQFGVMCIDAIEDGLVEAKDMFSVFVFSSDEQQDALREVFDRYQNSAMYADGDLDYLYDVLSLYNVKATSMGDDLYLSKIEPDRSRGVNTNMLLGKVYQKMGDYSKAIDHLAKAAKMKPFDDELLKELMEMVKKNKEK